MKKQYTKILIISIVCAVLSLLILYFTPIKTQPTYYEIENTKSDGEISDPEGYALLITTFGKMALNSMSALGNMFIVALIILPAFFILILIAFLQIIARLIQIGKEKTWKDVTSLVITIFSIILQIILCLILIFELIVFTNIYKLLLILAIAINVVAAVLYIIAICYKKNKNKDVEK